MPIPSTTKVWSETMDPADILDVKIDCSAFLEESDTIDTYILDTLTEAELFGLTIGVGAYAPTVNNKVITLWLSINPLFQSDTAFQGTGLTLPIEVTVLTTSVPPRKFQRTVAVKVAQR